MLVLEKGPYLGGASVVSGGMLWIPGNRYMDDIGVIDDRAEALHYLATVTDGRTDAAVPESILDHGDETLGFLAERANLRFCAMKHFPDYHPEWPGAHTGCRSLDPLPFDITPLGDLQHSLRPDHRPPLITVEYKEWRIFTRFPWEELARRAEKGLVARGRALVAPLVHARAGSRCYRRRRRVDVSNGPRRFQISLGQVISACKYSLEVQLRQPPQASSAKPHRAL